MTEVDIAGLAKLARLDVSAEELAKLEKELPDILAFVDTIQKASVSKDANSPTRRNVMRTDGNPYESGKYTETLLKAAPAREGDRIAVKQVLSRQRREKHE